MSVKRSPASVGAKLKKARERRDLSLHQIAESTKISHSVLQGLERDDIKYLPGGVLGRGYVRSFAAAVKLDPEITVAEFIAQFPDSSVKDGYPPATRVEGNDVADISHVAKTVRTIKMNGRDWSALLRFASVAVLGIVLAGVVAFAAPKRWPQWATLESWVTVPAEKPLTNLDGRPIQLVRPSKAPTLRRARALPVTTVTQASPGAVATSSASSAKVPVASSTPDAPAADATRASGESPRVVGDVSSGAIKVETPEAGTSADHPLTVVLTVSIPSWVIASVDGTTAVDRLFEVGDEQTLEVKDELVLTAGNRVAIAMTLNGAPAKPLGKTPSPLKVRITRANFKTYLIKDNSPKSP
jgi:cytoskeleton protein RodZ